LTIQRWGHGKRKISSLLTGWYKFIFPLLPAGKGKNSSAFPAIRQIFTGWSGSGMSANGFQGLLKMKCRWSLDSAGFYPGLLRVFPNNSEAVPNKSRTIPEQILRQNRQERACPVLK
jgi:hypothetical protein